MEDVFILILPYGRYARCSAYCCLRIRNVRIRMLLFAYYRNLRWLLSLFSYSAFSMLRDFGNKFSLYSISF